MFWYTVIVGSISLVGLVIMLVLERAEDSRRAKLAVERAFKR